MRMEEENSREAAEKLQQIGSSILGAARDELYLGMRFLDVALSSFVYQMDPSVSPFGTDGAVIYFHPQQLGGLYRQNRILPKEPRWPSPFSPTCTDVESAPWLPLITVN